MSVTPSSTVIGIFRDRSMAEQAMEALHNAGFAHEQIKASVPGTSGGFFEDLKSLFTGPGASGDNVANDLTNMGLSDEEARYYSNEYTNGNTLLSVKAPNREQEVLSLLHQYGAYNTRTGSAPFKETTNAAQQPSNYTQSYDYKQRRDYIQSSNYVQQGDYAAPMSESNMQHQEVQSPDQPADEHPVEDRLQNVATPTEDGENSAYRSDVVSAEPVPESQLAQPFTSGATSEPRNVVAPEHETNYQASPVDPTASQHGTNYQVDPTASQHGVNYQAAQANIVMPEREGVEQANALTPESEAVKQAPQANPATPEQRDELEQLQEQLQATQQQLQEARTQLEAAKEREVHFQTTRKREQQLQTTRQQLQEMQSELQATLAELRETQERMSHHQ